MPSPKTLGITAGALAAIALIGGGGFYALHSGSDGLALAAAEVTTLEPKDLTTTVTANGTLSAERELVLTTALTGAITNLDATVGQRVTAGQVLAHVDTSATQRELDAQRASQAAEHISGTNEAAAAQLQLNQFQAALDRGLNTEVNAARSAVATAQGAFDEAQRAADDAATEASRAGEADSVREAAAAVTTARAGLRTADNQAMQAALAMLGSTADAETDLGVSAATSLVNWVEADASHDDAARQLATAEDEYARALETSTTESAKDAGAKQRAAADAFRQLTDAELGQAAAELAAQNQIATQSQAVNHALASVAGASVAAEHANAKLEFDLGKADISTPLNGVITTVGAVQGKPAEGPIATVADDSTLLLKANVKEADLSELKKGNKVTFTSPSQPGKKFTGTVDFISPVAAAPAAAADSAAESTASAGASTKAEFPVTIRVSGDRTGLRLGSTAKANIITNEQKQALTVPLSAVLDNRRVLVLSDGRIESREITLGTTSDFEAAVTKGLRAGDQVITQPANYQDSVGQSAHVEEDQ